MEHADVKLLRSLAHIGQHLAHHADVLQGQQIPLALAAVERERLFALVVFFGEKGVHIADGGIFFDLKIGLAAREHIVLAEVGQIAHHAVCREHHQARVLHVHEIDHLIILPVALLGNAVFAAVVAIVEGGFVAVVTVGDIELAVGKVGAELFDDLFVGDDPQTVGDVVVVGERIRRVCGRFGVDRLQRGVLAVHIERIDLAEIAVGRLHQIQAVFLCLGERELMRQDHALGELLHLDARDQALDALALVVGVELHLIHIDRRLILIHQHALVAPQIEHLAGALIHVVALLGKLQTDHVVRILRNKRLALLLADDIIGRTAERFQLACLFGVKAHAPERFNHCHTHYLFSKINVP